MIIGPVITPDFVRKLERIEIDAWADLYRSADSATVDKCGVDLFFSGQAMASMAANVDVLALNRIIGAGLSGKEEHAVLDKLLGRAIELQAPRFFLQLIPGLAPGATGDWLRSRGLKHYNNWVKLYRGMEPVNGVKCDLQIELIDASQADLFAGIVCECFEWGDCVRPMVAAMVGQPGWKHYIAFQGARPAATAAIFIKDDIGWIDFAATLPDFRGQGAQAALLRERVRDATHSGCELLVVETAELTRDNPAPSYRNMVRYGFKQAYLRPNYIFAR